MMITMQPRTKLTIQDMKRPYEFAKIMRNADKVSYTMARTLEEDAEITILSKAQFEALLAGLDPLKVLAPKYKTIHFDMTSASLRSEEVYHVVLGKRIFPGNDLNSEVDKSGFEHKIIVEGTQLDFQVENTVAASGGVVASYPIASLDSISARKAGGALTVVSADLALGTVALNDGLVPVADGVAVELVYQAKEQLAVLIMDQMKQEVGVLISKEFNDFLVANAV